MLHCAGCKVASVVSEVQLTAGDWEVDGKQVGNWTSYIFHSLMLRFMSIYETRYLMVLKWVPGGICFCG